MQCVKESVDAQDPLIEVAHVVLAPCRTEIVGVALVGLIVSHDTHGMSGGSVTGMVEERYKMHMWGVGQRDSLKRAGKPKESSEIYLATSFHHDHGFGLDCYSVGPSLGCGAPALMKNGELIYPYCFKDYKVLDNGPLRSSTEWRRTAVAG